MDKKYYIAEWILHLFILICIWVGFKGDSWTLKTMATILSIEVILTVLRNYLNEKERKNKNEN